ncbi:hypothetical protein ACLMJK_003596 [Lecanora helva]
MARKARQRISYVLPLANSPGGHRLGVNGLAVDSDRSLLYSGGRDGLICAWDLDLDLTENCDNDVRSLITSQKPSRRDSERSEPTAFRQQVQAHTHWVNDILLAQSNTALVSASSDITVKVWRPHSEESQIPTTIGLHSDYVKCLASPGTHSDWVASGGLDHKIKLWDLDGGGEKLQINVGDQENDAKGSVYALSVRGSVLASGGPESIVRLWDPKSGKRITSFVGHTDNIRDILVNEDGDTVMTASSDQTVKIWSITAGRCMYTLTMHNDSVWSLYSDHPQLSLFYSSDRSGLVAKTDVRDCDHMDEGLSLAVAQEHEGVSKTVVAGQFIWTATSSSSINRWRDIDTQNELQSPESPRLQRGSSTLSRAQNPLSSSSILRNKDKSADSKIPLSCVLRISNTAAFPWQRTGDTEASTIYSNNSIRKISEAVIDQDSWITVPFYDLPDETIEGQNGLIKHVMLNDRRRVLTLDTAGEIIMWDLLQCIPIKSFGKRHLEDVTPEVNTAESVANWCGVDTRTGRLACILEENYCFDAEVYADELDLENAHEFRDDQRINLGKWILRFLFDRFIQEEERRDAAFRDKLAAETSKPSSLRRENAPGSIYLPTNQPQEAQDLLNDDDSIITPRATLNGGIRPAITPGLAIGTATPSVNGNNHRVQQDRLGTAEEGTSLEKQASQSSQSRNSADRKGDYFSSSAQVKSLGDDENKGPTTPGEVSHEGTALTTTQSPIDGERDDKAKESRFGKGFRMKFPKKLGRPSTDVKPVLVDEKSEESDKSEDKEDRTLQDNLYGTIQKIRYGYEERAQNKHALYLPSSISPSLLSETPKLHLPPYTTVIIQEERPDSGGVADLYRGTVRSVGYDADLIEKMAPTWLGDLLLKNQLPTKEIPKVSFVLLPYQDLLPSIASADGNSRLNANRMLRAKKILAYVAERIERSDEQPDPEVVKPESYLDLYCQNQLVAHDTTLATLRAHVWKTGGDVMLYYKSNGRRPELEQRHREKLAALAAEEPTAKTGPVMHSITS